MGMDGKPAASPQKRARSLNRGKAIEPALFAPMVHAAAAQIEGWNLAGFLSDPTKMARSLEALQKAIGTDAVFTAAATAMEAEAAGAELDWSTYPPQVAAPPFYDLSEASDLPDKLASSARIEAALETTRRLAATLTDGPLLATVVTGPATLARQLAGGNAEISDQGWEVCGRICAELTRLFCEAGAHLIVVAEEAFKPDDEKWRASLTPLLNIARFHKKPLATIGLGDATVSGEGFAVVGLPAAPDAWLNLPQCDGLVITCGEIPPNTSIPALTGKCQEMMANLQPS